MGLTNDAKDVVGFLRGVNLIVVLWNVENLSFPLDNEVKRVLATQRKNLENFLKVVCQISQMQEEVEELRSAIEDLVPDVERNFYTQENLTSLLSLFADVDTLQSFSFSQRSDFQRQTKPILLSLFSRLVKAMLWVRVALFDFDPGASVPELSADLKLACLALTKLFPLDAEMPTATELLSVVIKEWRSSPDVKHGLELTKNEPGNGLYRIVEELRGST